MNTFQRYCTYAFLASLGLSSISVRADIRSITVAAYTNDVAQLQAQAHQHHGYDRAYALYRIAQLGFASPGDHIRPALEEATAILKQRDDAESKVLLAAVNNLSMGLEPWRAQALAGETAELLTAGQASAEARPRALLIAGINRFYTPAAYGGGAAQALTLLQQAEALFANTDVSRISWGQAETQIWLGQVHASLGDESKAREHYEKALALDPECQWANHYRNTL